MEITKQNVEQLVNSALERVINHVEEKNFVLSSEKTLVFKFMWELAKIVSNDSLNYDFEYVAYNTNQNKFLDLLVWTDELYKVAFEFKLPKRKLSNSPITNTKPLIYRDIARVKHLVDTAKNNIHAGFFICAVNEVSYLNQKNADPTYSVSHEHKSTVKEYDGMSMPEQLTFRWNRIEWSDRQSKWICSGKYAWLEPYKIIN